MTEDTKELSQVKQNLMFISLLGQKLDILVVGGGKAGYIKAKAFCANGCNVKVISMDFIQEFKSLSDNENVKLIKRSYHLNYLDENHIIVIAVNNNDLIKTIIKDCDKKKKLYLNCSNYQEGLIGVPYQKETEEFLFGIQSKQVNPKLSVYIGKKIKNKLLDYDDFAKFSSSIRESFSDINYKREVMDFICSDSFKYFFDKEKHQLVLELFYGGKNFENKNSNEKK